MTYKELYEKATWLLEHSKISGKEYDNMIEPLNAEISAMPTVDAVPVEWIETDIEASAFSGYDMHAYEVATMLEEWKEKEGKKNEYRRSLCQVQNV